MNASHCAAYAYLHGDPVAIECEREIHDKKSDHRAVVYLTTHPGGARVETTLRWRSR